MTFLNIKDENPERDLELPLAADKFNSYELFFYKNKIFHIGF